MDQSEHGGDVLAMVVVEHDEAEEPGHPPGRGQEEAVDPAQTDQTVEEQRRDEVHQNVLEMIRMF